MKDVVIVSACRTAIGSFGGTLKNTNAAEIASVGDLVLLSPACASLDMYENFAVRGAEFSQHAKGLAA